MLNPSQGQTLRNPHVCLTGLLLIALCIGIVSGCSKPEPPPSHSVSSAEKKFQERCLKEFNLQVITRLVGKTLWIYSPTNDPIFDYESHKTGEPAQEKKSKFSMQYLDVKFHEQKFTAEYDVVDKKKSHVEDYGFGSSYTDTYVKHQNNLFTAITDTFFDIKETPQDPPINFIVVIITDIKKGLETKTTMYFTDIKRVMTGDLPYEEYSQRLLNETHGGPELIGDETGSHITFKDIVMGEFLAEQIKNRINFKFNQSDFGPSDQYDNDIAEIFANTFHYYDYTDYSAVLLNNLRLNSKLLFEPNQLAQMGEAKTNSKAMEDMQSKGRLIKIKFENGQATFEEPSKNSEEKY